VEGRLAEDARQVVGAAHAAARDLGHGWVGTEHVLIGALEHRALLPEAAQRLLPDAAAARRRLVDGICPPGRRPSDDALLQTLGIDLSEVRRRAAEAFGGEAVQRAALRVSRAERTGRRRRPRRRHGCRGADPRCQPVLAPGRLPMAPRLKRALEQAWRTAERRGAATVTTPALLDATLAIDGALAGRLLLAMGVDVAAVRLALAP
jgi:hypothetical protein